MLRAGWEFPQRKSLLRNNCNGTFTDVTDASGLGATVTQTQAGAWADIDDNDGYLDLFIANENAPAQLFHKTRVTERLKRWDIWQESTRPPSVKE